MANKKVKKNIRRRKKEETKWLPISIVLFIIIAVIAVRSYQILTREKGFIPNSQIDISDPATSFCLSNSGTPLIVKDKEEIEHIVCKLPDGKTYDKDEYFELNKPKKIEETKEEPIRVGLGSPASYYCVDQGGIVDIRIDEIGAQYGVCKFPDGTEIDEWELFRQR
jgi:uncharacterized protein